MWWKRTGWFWKSGFTAISLMLLVCISGCQNAAPGENITAQETGGENGRAASEGGYDVRDQLEGDTASEPDQKEDMLPEPEEEKIAEICSDLFQRAAKENKLDDLDRIRGIVQRFGEKGYPAVDSKNQMDMVRAQEVVRFCQAAECWEEREITIIAVNDTGGLIQYDLRAENGNLDVERSYYKYENGKVKKKDTGKYQARHWSYTKEGYLMFDGAWFSKQEYVLMSGQAEEYTALRVLPLEETYRELNRNYLLPVSYERNNMFLVDWSEEDFGELDFYDMYDIFYPKVMGKSIPYTPDENLGVGAVYQIPPEEFEPVFMSYFKIDRETLRKQTVYDAESGTYEYKPRGFYEIEYPEYPYPEVVGASQNKDGTITLEVNVVYPYAGDSKAYAHQVVVRPLEEVGVQYVSNRIIPSEENREENWHIPRLTEEKWEEIYGE